MISSNVLKENILNDLKNGLTITESAKKYGTSYENAYRIKKKYYDNK